MDLILDIGNTRTKAALFEGDRLRRLGAFGTEDAPALMRFLNGERPTRAAIATVAAAGEELLNALGPDLPIERLTTQHPAPIRSAYTTAETLGIDRWANAVAAAAMFPGRAVLAIDLGTCITYDLVDASRAYLGGAISPGSRMRAQAMHQFSARLPLVQPDHAAPPFGTSTTGSLKAGILHGVVGELRCFIEEARQHHPGLAVVLTGGDALAHARALKSGIFAHPYLTLEGLRRILHHGRGAAASLRSAGPGTAG